MMGAACSGWVRCGAVSCLALILALVAPRWLPVGADRQGAAAEVVLVVRDMTFYLDGQFTTPNPSLTFDAGARVTLVLRNEDPGMTHNFAIPAWNVATRELDAKESARIEFVVPAGAGPQAYQCTPHARLMHGAIAIR